MNFALAREIYGLTPWFVDANSLTGMLSMLSALNSGLVLEIPEVKYNTPGLVEIKSVKSDTKLIRRPWQLENRDNFEAIGVININGPITVSGGESSLGMEDLSSYMLEMAQDNRIKGFIILTNSGGGSTGAISIMTDTINEVKKTKPVYGLVKKGGMAGSAAYAILTPCTKIFSEDGMNIVGSAGTMVEFDGKKANSTAPDGTKSIRLYASKSTDKNKGFEEALNNDNYEIIINELLNPINENLLSLMETNRPVLKGTSFDNGHTVFSKNAIGTFIDGVATFAEVANMVMVDAKLKPSSNPSLISNTNKKMTKEEFKSQHPTAYNEVVAEGAAAEQERVAAFMVYQSADPEGVAAGIASGKPINAVQTQQFLVKMMSAGKLADLKSDNPKDVVAPESGIAPKEGDDLDEAEAHYAELDKKLK